MTGGMVTRDAVSAPEPLGPDHDLSAFESGVRPLDEWLQLRGRQNEGAGASRTFVMSCGRQVVGYYSLAAGSVTHEAATSRVRRNMPRPIPVILLGRLAIDRRWQRKGLGADLLRDALLRTTTVAETIGVRAMLVHAISDEAKAFYEHFGFRPSPVEPLTLMIATSEAERLITT